MEKQNNFLPAINEQKQMIPHHEGESFVFYQGKIKSAADKIVSREQARLKRNHLTQTQIEELKNLSKQADSEREHFEKEAVGFEALSAEEKKEIEYFYKNSAKQKDLKKYIEKKWPNYSEKLRFYILEFFPELKTSAKQEKEDKKDFSYIHWLNLNYYSLQDRGMAERISLLYFLFCQHFSGMMEKEQKKVFSRWFSDQEVSKEKLALEFDKKEKRLAFDLQKTTAKYHDSLSDLEKLFERETEKKQQMLMARQVVRLQKEFAKQKAGLEFLLLQKDKLGLNRSEKNKNQEVLLTRLKALRAQAVNLETKYKEQEQKLKQALFIEPQKGATLWLSKAFGQKDAFSNEERQQLIESIKISLRETEILRDKNQKMTQQVNDSLSIDSLLLFQEVLEKEILNEQTLLGLAKQAVEPDYEYLQKKALEIKKRKYLRVKDRMDEFKKVLGELIFQVDADRRLTSFQVQSFLDKAANFKSFKIFLVDTSFIQSLAMELRKLIM